jgi:hypothetical protein
MNLDGLFRTPTLEIVLYVSRRNFLIGSRLLSTIQYCELALATITDNRDSKELS